MADPDFRPNPYIVSRFFERLQRARARGGQVNKTRLQMATSLKWPDFARYVERLTELGLLSLEEESGETLVRATEKGWEVYYSLLRVLAELTRTPI